ncbi:RDD family protein [Mucilaginibacter lacusdianchii]|uniref:RDD family protein n=1 Tax=Mucilaginibacter lacusdianchii TaxID=2684211 RepID=UPI00131B09E3|nr:RDD family protein [Mucilaginibacter sp. JXJ CY 39]
MDSYFVKDNQGEKGPFTFEELTDGRLEPNDLIRTAFSNWTKASDMPDFVEYFRYEGYYFPTETNLASFSIRVLAYLIDVFLLSLMLAIGLGVYLGSQHTQVDYQEYLLANLKFVQLYIYPPLHIIYFALLTASPLGGSLGQVACRLIIVDNDGRKPSFGKALSRSIGKFVSNFFFGIGFLVALGTDYKQALHDLVAKTYVVRKDVY